MKLKMRINDSVTLKLFVITTAIFILFISGTFISQSLFFEDFYINKKTSDIESNIKKFQINYDKLKNDEDASKIVKEFEYNANAKLVVLDTYGSLKFITNFQYERKDSVKVAMINQIIRKWTNNYKEFVAIKKAGKMVTYVTSKKESDIRNIVCILPDAEKGETIFGLSSLQPVNEASMVIKEFYLYFYIVAVFLIIVLSFIYSNMITKPLVKINKAASKMSNLDFSEKCYVKGNDEIGNLAATLNFLSENLHKSLGSLKSANEKLKEDIERERELEKMRKEFVAGVSHELKTPITLIDGYAEAIKDNVVDEEEKEYYIDVIIDEARMMGKLVSDMLDLSQLESGNFKLIKEEFFIDTLIADTAKKFSALFERKFIKLKLTLIDDIKVYADYTRIEQVLTNYLTNAIRYSKDNDNIWVRMIKESDSIRVEVENNGEKISQDEIEKIWGKFYKIEKSRNRKFGGTGIGLSIVKNIVMLHGGTFGVENTSVGVKFYFSLNI